jgi:hypothetical protein
MPQHGTKVVDLVHAVAGTSAIHHENKSQQYFRDVHTITSTRSVWQVAGSQSVRYC